MTEKNTYLRKTSADLVVQNDTPAMVGSNVAEEEIAKQFPTESRVLKLILDHQESRCTGNHNIAPKHRSSKNESIQTFIFIQPGLSRHPFHDELQANSNMELFWSSTYFFMLFQISTTIST
jgi:hypothetical protein